MKFNLQLLAAICATLLVFAVGKAQETNTGQRLTPSEIDALTSTGASAGTSGVNGIQTRVLKGDPTKSGLYTIQLAVPANTKIDAHTHPDDRVATVISGTWNIGYGCGNRNRDIAERLFISEETVKVHIKHIMEKLGASDRTQAVAIAVRRGFMQL